MVEKSVTDMIFEKFAQNVTNDSLFQEISDDLVGLIQKRASKSEIKKLLGKKR